VGVKCNKAKELCGTGSFSHSERQWVPSFLNQGRFRAGLVDVIANGMFEFVLVALYLVLSPSLLCHWRLKKQHRKLFLEFFQKLKN